MIQARSLPDLSGTMLDDGRYLLIHVLGSGSYGKVYKALDMESPSCKPVYFAIKCLLKPRPGTRAEAFQQREFSIHRRLTEAAIPNTVAVHSRFSDSHFVYIVLDLCEGGDLFNAITKLRIFERNDQLVKSVFLQIIDAVQACHDQGVFHRDLKPENILRMQDGSIRLADFGFATEARVSQEFKCGSWFYMSPECINEEIKHERYSTRHNDIWSMGVILTNMITSRHPWCKALTTDDCFSCFLHDRDYLRRTFFISDAANYVLQRIFSLNPLSRISLLQLREEILNIDTFFCDNNDTLPLPAPTPTKAAAPPPRKRPSIPRIVIDAFSFCDSNGADADPEEEVYLFPSPAEGVEPLGPEHAPHSSYFSPRHGRFSSSSSSCSSSSLITPPSTAVESDIEISGLPNGRQTLRPQVITFFNSKCERFPSTLRARFVKRDRRVTIS